VEDIFDISGKTALITGSTRGIGRALAQGLAAAHSRILIHGRDAARAEDAASALRAEQGADAIACAFDVTSPEQVEHGIRRIEEEIGDIDILVNNAGIQRRAPFADFPVPDWDEVLATNLTSAFLVSRQVAKSMIRRGRGKIVNIGSVQSQLGRPGITPYAASKGGLVMLTRGMCADLAPYGIQVNAIAPGYPQSFRHAEGWLLIVPASVFDRHVRFAVGCVVHGVPGVPGRAPAPTAPGCSSFRVAGIVRAGQAGAGRAQSRCQQVRNVRAHGQVSLMARVRWRAWRASLAGRCQTR
jgi:gluconate 5-dehydrogenase